MKYKISFKNQLLIVGVIIATVSNMLYFTTAKQTRMNSKNSLEREFNIKEKAPGSASLFPVTTKNKPDSIERGITIKVIE
jgi:hypothetical protein